MLSPRVQAVSTSDDLDRFDTAFAAAATRSTGDLVVELSQLEHAVGVWRRRGARGVLARAEGDLGSLLLRQRAVLNALRSRGLNFPEPSFDPSPDPARPPSPPQDPLDEVRVEFFEHDPSPRQPSEPGEVDLRARVEQLKEALSTRTVIGHAVGIVMERRNLTADEAFEVLSATSSETHRTLPEVAAALCESRHLPPEAPQ